MSPSAPSRAHLVLLGDGILGGEPRDGPSASARTLDLLEECSLPGDPPSRIVQLLAVAGATARSCLDVQLPRISADATHIALSVGCCDSFAVSCTAPPVASVAEALAFLGDSQAYFDSAVDATLVALKRRNLPVLLIIPPNPPPADVEPAAAVHAGRLSLVFFADALFRAAARHSCSVLDLRLLLDATVDTTGPSGEALASVGACKLAAKVVEFVIRNYDSAATLMPAEP